MNTETLANSIRRYVLSYVEGAFNASVVADVALNTVTGRYFTVEIDGETYSVEVFGPDRA